MKDGLGASTRAICAQEHALVLGYLSGLGHKREGNTEYTIKSVRHRENAIRKSGIIRTKIRERGRNVNANEGCADVRRRNRECPRPIYARYTDLSADR